MALVSITIAIDTRKASNVYFPFGITLTFKVIIKKDHKMYWSESEFLFVGLVEILYILGFNNMLE